MGVDTFVVVTLLIACYKGYSKGLIIAMFSLIALVVGLAAALKLSAVTANYLKESSTVSAQWLPILSFALVFIAAVLLVRIGAKMIEKTVQFAMMGWVNKIGGMALYVLLYATMLSVCIFYLEKIGFFTAETLNKSVTYPYMKPLAPLFIDGIAVVLPFLKNTFAELEAFFGKIANGASGK